MKIEVPNCNWSPWKSLKNFCSYFCITTTSQQFWSKKKYSLSKTFLTKKCPKENLVSFLPNNFLVHLKCNYIVDFQITDPFNYDCIVGVLNLYNFHTIIYMYILRYMTNSLIMICIMREVVIVLSYTGWFKTCGRDSSGMVIFSKKNYFKNLLFNEKCLDLFLNI